MSDGTADDHGDPLLRAVVGLVDGSPFGWGGTASQLLSVLCAQVSPDKRGQWWPGSAVGLGRRLTRLVPELAEVWRDSSDVRSATVRMSGRCARERWRKWR